MFKTTAEMIEVMQAFERGEDVEFRNIDSGTWSPATTPRWDWRTKEYRIAPKPKKTVELYQWLMENDGRIYISNAMTNAPSTGKVIKRLDHTKIVVELD